MSRFHFNTPCPHCAQPLQVDMVVIYNIDSYHAPKVAKAECCGRGVRISPVVTYRADALNSAVKTDDWGRPLNTNPVPQT